MRAEEGRSIRAEEGRSMRAEEGSRAFFRCTLDSPLSP